eukprot:jgi/Chlat1/3351/Chrsp23S03662
MVADMRAMGLLGAFGAGVIAGIVACRFSVAASFSPEEKPQPPRFRRKSGLGAGAGGCNGGGAGANVLAGCAPVAPVELVEAGGRISSPLGSCDTEADTYTSLLEIHRDISGQHNVQDAIACAISATYRLLNSDRVSFFLIDEVKNELYVAVSEDAVGRRIPIGSGIAGAVAKTGKPVNVMDVYCDQRFSMAFDAVTGYRTRSLLGVPVHAPSGQVVGVLEAVNKIEDPNLPFVKFTSHDEFILSSIADIAGGVLVKLQMYEAELLERRKTDAMLDMMKAVSSVALEFPALVEKIVAVLVRLLQADGISLFLVDPIKQELWTVWQARNMYGRCQIGRGLVGYCAQTKDIINCPDTRNDPRFDPVVDALVLGSDADAASRARTILCLPVFDQLGHLVAVIEAVNKRAGRVSPLSSSGYHGVSPRTSHSDAANSPRRTRSFKVEMANGTSTRDVVASLAPSVVKPFIDQDIEVLQAVCGELSAALSKKTLEAVYTKLLRDDASVDSSFVSLYSEPVDRSNELDYMSPANANRCIFDLTQTFTFDVLEASDEELLQYIEQMFLYFDLFSKFKVPLPVFRAFLASAANKYRKVAYHNFRHGAAVCQMAFYMLASTTLSSRLTPLDIFACLVAALCHDVDHPGCTNAFEVNRGSELARLYNDVSVLENHHACTLFTLLDDPQCNIFASLDQKQRVQMRKTIISAILATDMVHHQSSCDVLKEALLNHEDPLSAPPLDSNQFVINTVLHAADLGSSVLPRALAVKWANLILEEFRLQAEAERQLGLPIAAFMNHMNCELNCARVQVNFVNYVVSPLWGALASIFPDLAPCMAHLEDNRQHYIQELERLTVTHRCNSHCNFEVAR